MLIMMMTMMTTTRQKIKTPIVVNAGGELTVKTSFIPLVRLADRKIA